MERIKAVKELFILITFICCAAVLYGQDAVPDEVEPVSFAVLPLLQLEGPGHIPTLLSTVIERKFASSPFYRIIPQENMNNILRSKGSDLRVDRCLSIDCADEIAALLGVDFALMGTVRGRSNHIELMLRLVNVSDGSEISRFEKHIYDSREIDVSAEIVLREISAMLFPEYLDYIGTLRTERDITPDLTLDDTEEEGSEPSNSSPVKKQPIINDAPLDIEPLYDNPFTWNTAGLVAGLAGINAGSWFQILEASHYYSYLEYYDTYEKGVDPYSISQSWMKVRDAYSKAENAGTASALLWGGGMGLSGFSLWSGNNDLAYMSKRGKLLFSGGYFFQAAAGAVDMLSLYYLGEAHVSYMQYKNATSGFDPFWSDYRRYTAQFMVFAGVSAAMRFSAVLMEAGGAFWHAKQTTPLIEGFWDKMLYSSSILFLAGGNLYFTHTIDLQRDMNTSHYKYLNLDPASPLRDNYRSRWYDDRDEYRQSLIIAGSLWGGGVLCYLTAVLFDFPDPFAGKGKSLDEDNSNGNAEDMQFMLVPGTNGLGIVARYSY